MTKDSEAEASSTRSGGGVVSGVGPGDVDMSLAEVDATVAGRMFMVGLTRLPMPGIVRGKRFLLP